MGQIQLPAAPQSLLLTSVDRLQSSNAGAGISVAASHVILLGENAGLNLGGVTNFIVLGNDSLRAGFAQTANNGSNIIGGQILSALVNTTPPAQRVGPFTVIGFNDFPLLANRFGAVVAIGANIGASQPAAGNEVSASILLGNDVMGNQRTLAANGGTGAAAYCVIIGDRAARGVVSANSGGGVNFSHCVIIGAEAAELSGFDGPVPGTTFDTTVAIGRQALRVGASQQNTTIQSTVAIGNLCASGQVSGTENVMIGSGISIQTTGCNAFTLIGSNIVGTTQASKNRNIALGSGISLNNLGDRNIVIGAGANTINTMPAGTNGAFLVETYDGAFKRTLLYGLVDIAAPAGLVVGNSTEGTNRDLPGLNILKLVNGARDGGLTAPIGGGFFYCETATGNVRWVTPGNVDYTLTGGGNLGTFVVAALPAAPPAGSRAFASNALAPAFGAAVAGGGAVFIPVFFNGAAWIVG